jgi:hypothetical protein
MNIFRFCIQKCARSALWIMGEMMTGRLVGRPNAANNSPETERYVADAYSEGNY